MSPSLFDRLPTVPGPERSRLFVENHRAGDLTGMWLKHPEYANLRFLYSILVMKVYEHERDLNQGRFLHFDHTPQQWTVAIHHENRVIPWWEKCEGMINWIAENADSPWSLGIEMEHIQKGTFTFSFQDPTIATFFKVMFV